MDTENYQVTHGQITMWDVGEIGRCKDHSVFDKGQIITGVLLFRNLYCFTVKLSLTRMFTVSVPR